MSQNQAAGFLNTIRYEYWRIPKPYKGGNSTGPTSIKQRAELFACRYHAASQSATATSTIPPRLTTLATWLNAVAHQKYNKKLWTHQIQQEFLDPPKIQWTHTKKNRGPTKFTNYFKKTYQIYNFSNNEHQDSAGSSSPRFKLYLRRAKAFPS
jgi:hypothetical protein